MGITFFIIILSTVCKASAKLPIKKNLSKSLPRACSLRKKDLWNYHHIQAWSHLCLFPQMYHGKPNVTSSHSELHVRSHFEIIRGTRMNSPRGTKLIPARNIVSGSVIDLIWTDGESLYCKSSIRVEWSLELFSTGTSLNTLDSFVKLFLLNSFCV